VIGEVLGITDPCERDAGTIASIAASMKRGGHVFRVHDADAAWQAVKVLHGLETAF
jgi:dihydropteroate synthase